MIFTCSWDDGHPADLRLAELLARHGMAATFYIPRHNVDGRPVMGAAEIRSLAAAGFEIGAHGVSHQRLTKLPLEEAALEMADGRRWLEDILGHSIELFCYPGGKQDRNLRQALARQGFRWARGTEMFRLDADGADAFALPTTLQAYPHGLNGCLRNWLRHGGGGGRLHNARRYLAGGPEAVLESALANDGLFHLWGHSWELEELSSWSWLNDLLRLVAERVPPAERLANGMAWDRRCR